MHLNAAHYVVSRFPMPVEPDWRSVNDANRLDVGSVIREFSGVMENQNGRIDSGESVARCLEVPLKNLCFGDSTVGKETISGLGVGPILANQRNTLANAIGKLLEELSKSLVESGVAELAADKFMIDPGVGLGGGGVINPL
jgi:hypothetical protein